MDIKKISFYLALILLSIIIIVFFISVGKSPSPPSIPKPNLKYSEDQKNIWASEAPQINRDATVGQLVKKLPYSGQYFRFYFDYPTARFILELDSNHIDEGNKNFDAFLKENKVEERSWVQNLTIKNVDFSKTQISQPATTP